MISISSRKEGSATVVQVSGRLDADAAPGFELSCVQLVRGAEKVIVLDLGGVQYISSSGLRSLLVIGKYQQQRGGVLRLANLTPTVAQLFEQSNFQSLFPCFDSAEKAAEG
ncbi:MAG: STAS domain-containing protein [Terriglobia bacterium]